MQPMMSVSPRRHPEDITTVMTTLESRHAFAHSAPRVPDDSLPALESDRTLIQSVERALAILECLSSAPGALKLRDITASCAINSSTCHHLLDTLVSRGYVSRSGKGLGYRLGSRAWALGRAGTGCHGWIDHVLPLAHRVREQAGEAVIIAALDEGRLSQLARLDTPLSRLTIARTEELSDAAHAAAVGKAILAWLPEPSIARVIAERGLRTFTSRTISSLDELAHSLRQARRHGFALDDEEFIPGIVSMGCALRGPAGEVLGAIGCSLGRQRATDDRLVQLHGILSQAAMALPRVLATIA
jgi:IclR family transcriptional regulator, acetate operon repressor